MYANVGSKCASSVGQPGIKVDHVRNKMIMKVNSSNMQLEIPTLPIVQNAGHELRGKKDDVTT